MPTFEELLRVDLERAREALRDIREYTEHSGSWEIMLTNISTRLDQYWKGRDVG